MTINIPNVDLVNGNVYTELVSISVFVLKIFNNQRTNGPVNTHLISGPTVSTKTSKIVRGQPRVIIYINFVELESPMLRAKFQDHRTSDSGEDF